MQTKLNIYGFIVMLMFLSACSSSRPILDDDVYILKTAAIPIGYNLLDETSYETFKYREVSNNPTTGYYNPMNASTSMSNAPASYRSPYFYPGIIYPMYNSGGFGNYMSFSPYTNYNPYVFYHNAGFNGYNSFYNNPYLGYGGNSYYYGGFNTGSGFSSNAHNLPGNGHYVSGPRSTGSGYFSGVSRGGTQQLKAQIPNQQSNPTSFGNSNLYSREIRQTISRTGVSSSHSQQSSYERVSSNQRAAPARYNNQQARPVQSRGNGNYTGPESRVNSGRSSSFGTSGRSNSSVSAPSQRSSGGSATSPQSRSTSTPASSSGGRRQ
jgi:hypothetical protein